MKNEPDTALIRAVRLFLMGLETLITQALQGIVDSIDKESNAKKTGERLLVAYDEE